MSAFAHRAHGGEPSVIPFFGSQALLSRGLAAQSAFMEEGFDALLRGVVRGSPFCFSPPFILIKQDVRLAVVRSVLCGKYSSTLRRVQFRPLHGVPVSGACRVPFFLSVFRAVQRVCFLSGWFAEGFGSMAGRAYAGIPYVASDVSCSDFPFVLLFDEAG